MTRTAVATLFTFWPPAPPEWKMSHLQVLLVDVDLYVVGLGEDGDGSGAGVDAALGLGLGHALDAVHAAFVLEAGEGALAVELEDDLLVAALLTLVGGDDFGPPALALGVARVHAVEVAREEAGFLAARAGAHLDDDVALVVRVPGQEGELDALFDAQALLFEGVDLFPGQAGHLRVGALVEQGARVFELGGEACDLAVERDHGFERGALLRQRLQALVIGDHVGPGHLLCEGLEAFFEDFELVEHVS